MVLPTFLHMSDEKLISKEQTVSQKIRQELFKEMSDRTTEFWQSPYCLKLLHFTNANDTKKKSTKKIQHNTLAPYLVLGCNNDDPIMEPDISKLEVHAVKHYLPGGGNATTHAVPYINEFRSLFIEWNAQDWYRSFNFKFLKYYYCVSYSEEDWWYLY